MKGLLILSEARSGSTWLSEDGIARIAAAPPLGDGYSAGSARAGGNPGLPAWEGFRLT